MYKFFMAQREKSDIAAFVNHNDAHRCSMASGGTGAVKQIFVYESIEEFKTFHDGKIRAEALSKLTEDEKRSLGLIEYSKPEPQGFR